MKGVPSKFVCLYLSSERRQSTLKKKLKMFFHTNRSTELAHTILINKHADLSFVQEMFRREAVKHDEQRDTEAQTENN